MMANDRHEGVTDAWYLQLKAKAETDRAAIEKKITKRGDSGFMDEGVTIMTQSEMKARISAARVAAAVARKKGNPMPEDSLAPG